MSDIERRRQDQGPWTLKGQGLDLWPKVVEGPGFEDEERIEVVPARQLQGAVSAARAELLVEITAALRAEGYIYRCYGPRAADFIRARFGGQS